MEINNIKAPKPEGRVIFIRLSLRQAEELEKIRVQIKGRGIATVIRRIIETALAEGVTVNDGKRKKAA